MATTVVFLVPVHVEVDEEEGTVLSVKVDDEAVTDPVDIFAIDGDVDEVRRRRAGDVASSASWPAWELGP